MALICWASLAFSHGLNGFGVVVFTNGQGGGVVVVVVVGHGFGVVVQGVVVGWGTGSPLTGLDCPWKFE